jgi:hypothetical protein
MEFNKYNFYYCNKCDSRLNSLQSFSKHLREHGKNSDFTVCEEKQSENKIKSFKIVNSTTKNSFYFSVSKKEFLEIWKLIKPKLDLELEIQIKNEKKEIDCANWIKINQVSKTRLKIMQMISTWLNDNISIDFSDHEDFILFNSIKFSFQKRNNNLYRFKIDKNGSHNICFCCCQIDKEVIMCDNKDCPYVFCLKNKCSGLNKEQISKIKNSNLKYYCSVCNSKKSKKEYFDVTPSFISKQVLPIIDILVKIDLKKDMYFSHTRYTNRSDFIEKPEFIDGVYVNLSNNFYVNFDSVFEDINNVFNQQLKGNHKEKSSNILKYRRIFNEEWNKRIYYKYMILNKGTSLTPRNIKATDVKISLKRKNSSSSSFSKNKRSTFI